MGETIFPIMSPAVKRDIKSDLGSFLGKFFMEFPSHFSNYDIYEHVLLLEYDQKVFINIVCEAKFINLMIFCNLFC